MEPVLSQTEPTDDFTPMEREMVAQARLITDAKYSHAEMEFIDALKDEVWLP